MATLRRIVSQSATAASLVLSVSLATQAQTVTPELSNTAQEACKASAVAKGFQVANVVSVEPKPGTADGVNVVLDLIRNGEPFKLTCGYTKTAGAAIGESSPAATTTTPATAPAVVPTTAPATTTATQDTGFPWWWWLLLPLVGIPLALMFRPREREVATRTTTTARSYTTNEAIARGAGRSVNVYAGPGTNYDITGTIQDGQRVGLSGRTNNNWTELTNGGWVPTGSLEAVSSYTSR